jgi:hypothetical protein
MWVTSWSRPPSGNAAANRACERSTAPSHRAYSFSGGSSGALVNGQSGLASQSTDSHGGPGISTLGSLDLVWVMSSP